MAFRISSVCCLLASTEGLLGLGGGGTGPASTICWGLTFKGRLCVKCEGRYENQVLTLYYNNHVYFSRFVFIRITLTLHNFYNNCAYLWRLPLCIFAH